MFGHAPCVGVQRRIEVRRILRAARHHIDVKPALIGEVPSDRLRGDSVAGTLEGMTGAAENVGQRSCIAGRIVGHHVEIETLANLSEAHGVTIRCGTRNPISATSVSRSATPLRQVSRGWAPHDTLRTPSLPLRLCACRNASGRRCP